MSLSMYQASVHAPKVGRPLISLRNHMAFAASGSAARQEMP